MPASLPRVAAGAMDLDDYWLRLQQSADEQQALIEAVIVPETWFFRYPESFAALAGLAHKRLAELAGVDRKTINRIENGHFSPSLDTLTRLSVVLKCRLADLVEAKRSKR